MPIVDRVSRRGDMRSEDKKEDFISIFDIIERITNEVVQNNRELVTDITLGKIPESALEVAIIKIINKYNFKVLNKNREELVKEVLDHVFRYGPIQKLLDQEKCNGVFVNGPDNVWAKIGNKIIKTDVNFDSIRNVTAFIYTVKTKLRGEINENSPLAKFDDKENKLRIVCCIQPMSHISPTVVIRKHSAEGFSLKNLVTMGMMSEGLAEDLERYNDAGANMIFCGRGGAGKTTLMRALLEEVSPEERILAMEEQPELYLKHPNAVQITVKRNENGKIINMVDVAEKGLIMTIDRYVFGEIRSSEAMSFFYGSFSGNTTMTSLHSGSARQALRKAMIMMKMSGTDLGDELLMDMLYESTNIIVFLDSFVVTEVIEVVMSEGEYRYNDLWKFNITKRHTTFLDGDFKKVGQIRSQAMIEKLGQKDMLREEEKIADNICSSNNVIHISGNLSAGSKH